MIDNVKLLDNLSAMSQHAAQRHAVIADNIANADTPGFKARDIEPFADIFAKAHREGKTVNTLQAKVTHMTTPDITSPNGNNVSLEQQMMLSAQTKGDHDMALAVYRKTLDMMKMAMGKNI